MHNPGQSANAQRPFLKWAGGKMRHLPLLKDLLPSGKRYIEPFVGAGAVFLNVDYPDYLLGELNQDLVNVYRCLQTEGEDFIQLVNSFFVPSNNCKQAFLELRETFNTTSNVRLKSALFIYLNRHGYNGLCRYNASGGYNVPFGQYKRPTLNMTACRHFHQRLQKTDIHCQDFTKTLKQARRGDVVYCDPPYAPLSVTANFRNYAKTGFSDDQQVQLAELAQRACNKGATVLISNHDTAYTRKLYRDADMVRFAAHRSISCKAERQPAPELVAIYRPD